MAKILIILAIAFSFEAFGVIVLKRGLDQIGPRYTARETTMPVWKNVLKLIGDWFSNGQILLGLFLETIFFILLQYLLAQREVSFVWPLTALSFVMTTLAAKFFLLEKITSVRWAGVFLIVIGAALISLSEYSKQNAPVSGKSPPLKAE